MKRKNIVRIIALLTVLSIATFFGFQVNSQTTDNSEPSLVEMTELEKRALDSSEEYTGPQTVKALMKAFDGIYNRNHLKTTVIVSRKAGSGSSNTSTLYESTVYDGIHSKTTISGPSSIFIQTTGEVNLSRMLDSTAEKMHVNQFTNAEIDARYPREAWLQLLLNKGITIKNLGEYASYLSKRHTLALLKNNPSLRKTGILGIPSTDEWATYKTAYMNRLVNDHAQIRQTAKRIERAKVRARLAKVRAEHAKARIESTKGYVERAKVWAERAKQRAEHAKARAERAKQRAEHAKALIESTKGYLENLRNHKLPGQIKTKSEEPKKELEQIKTVEPLPNEPKWNRIKKSPYPAL
ncbi:MAG: hypothetical protein OXN27_15105 [Candidatus Poribacteria bacterium]|nr:hypothetical protein [Candidatus Poribacteria bacterium]